MIYKKDSKTFFGGNMKNGLSGWGLMIPGIILFTFFLWYPIIYGIVLSFAETKGLTIIGFTGLGNYEKILKLPEFTSALVNCFSYTFWSLIIGFFVPIILAVIISELTHGASFFRISMYFPSIVPIIATTLMWKFLMNPGGSGMLNAIIMSFGHEPFQWLENESFTIPLIISTMT